MNSNQKILMLLFRNHQLISSIGNFTEFFLKNKNKLLSIGIYIDKINWLEFFTETIDISQTEKVVNTYDGQQVLVNLEKNSNKLLPFDLVITFINITSLISGSPSVLTNEGDGESNPVFQSAKMQEILTIIQQISHVDSTILLLGESGVGKSVIAKYIHEVSSRSSNQFISINCGSIPETLIESELFGYESGSFTGSKKSGKEGLFEAANGGTIFLDEIAELPLNMQGKLLEVLQEKKFRKVGGTNYKHVSVRIISATNKDLYALTQRKKFREDLFYRLNVIPITIPPLRERKEDIPYLISLFIRKFNQRYGLSKVLPKILIKKLEEYHWPGNVRELENQLERYIVTNVIPGYIDNSDKTYETNDFIDAPFSPLKQAKKALEREMITKAYQKYKSTYKVAELLEVDQSTIAKKIKEYNITKA